MPDQGDACPPGVLSVVIPSLDGASTIASAIDSVPRLAGVEIVVVDDGSTDETAAIAAEMPGTTVLRQPRGGRCAARNAGARAASGRYVLFLDDDDQLVEDGITALVDLLGSPTFEAPLVRLALDHRTAGGGRSRVAPERSIAAGPYIPGSFAVRADRFAAVGGYDEVLDYAENTELFLRVLGEDERATVLDEVSVRHHHRADVATHYRSARMAAVDRILAVHRARLIHHPAMLGDMLAIAAHDHYRSGDRGPAVRFAWRSARVKPTFKALARMLRIAFVPARLARRGA